MQWIPNTENAESNTKMFKENIIYVKITQFLITVSDAEKVGDVYQMKKYALPYGFYKLNLDVVMAGQPKLTATADYYFKVSTGFVISLNSSKSALDWIDLFIIVSPLYNTY